MEGIELICFEIINNAGEATAHYSEALQNAKKGLFERADLEVEEGNKYFNLSHKVHSKLIQKEASGEKFEITLLLVHAEDQLMFAENTKMRTSDLIDSYKCMHRLFNQNDKKICE